MNEGQCSLLDRIYINTRDDCAIARRYGLGAEVLEYATGRGSDDSTLVRDGLEARLRGIDRRILHGPISDLAPGTDDPLTRTSVRRQLDAAYGAACSHGIKRLVFHSGYVPGTMPDQLWLANAGAFWREYMADKPRELAVHIENVADTEPTLLAELIDAIGDPRVTACLDVGHAQINSLHRPTEWVTTLGSRIGHVHLHDNDGIGDRHWPLGRGIIAIAKVLDTLTVAAPQCTITLECEPGESLAWLAGYCEPR